MILTLFYCGIQVGCAPASNPEEDLKKQGYTIAPKDEILKQKQAERSKEPPGG